MNTNGEYLSAVPKPLLDALVHGRVVPIVGAGFSKNAIIPDGLSMADWNELGKLVAEQITSYGYESNPIDAFSYFEHEYGRANLVELLKELLHTDEVRPGEVHSLLCELFSGTICTTNYDSLIEDAAKSFHRPMSVIVTEDALTIQREREGRLLKLHGDFNHPERMVITERDYDVYLDRNPLLATYLANLFISNTMLLIGYSLDDSDFRSVWQIINRRLGRMTRQAYAIEVNATAAKVARFERRNIRVINLPMSPNGYGASIESLLRELKDYVDKERDKAARSSDYAVNAQLLVPPEHNTLCFISCAYTRMSRLSELLYPALQEVGVTPVRVDEIVTAGDNWVDAGETAIRKSRFVIIDVSDANENVAYEMGLSVAAGRDVLPIREKGSAPVPFSLLNRRILTYSFDTPDDNMQFLRSVQGWMRETIGQGGASLKDGPVQMLRLKDAERLFEEGEYSACVVLACSQFESYARHLIPESARVPYGLGGLRPYLSRAMEVPLSDSKDYERLILLRNRVVHEGYQATREEARDTMTYLNMLVSLLNK